MVVVAAAVGVEEECRRHLGEVEAEAEGACRVGVGVCRGVEVEGRWVDNSRAAQATVKPTAAVQVSVSDQIRSPRLHGLTVC